MKLKTFLRLFAGLAVILVLFRFIAVDYWWVRMFDFPHVQLTCLTVLAFLVYFIRFDFKNKKDYLFAFALIACMSYQFIKIYPYTFLAPYAVNESETTEKENKLSIYSANVYQDNDDRKVLTDSLKNIDADLLLFMETDRKWMNDIRKVLSEDYKYRVEYPLDNTYGILMYSKKELIDAEVKFQVDDSIPSIFTKLRLDNGELIQIYAIHPTPPMPMHNPKSTDRDAEMMKTALLANNRSVPVMVIGDFNDVAWSETTLLFQNVGLLLDPRKGRGFYNTYNANNWLFRWPLDHIFLSEEFRIQKMERAGDINSDHFPVRATISLEKEGADIQKMEPPSKETLQRAKDQIEGDTPLPGEN